jgi:hypothetical protein
MMKTLRLTIVCLAAAFPLSTTGTYFVSETVSVPITQSSSAAVDEITFEWENAMVLAAADPCAKYLAPRYDNGGHEGNYDDDGNDLRI